MLSAGGPTLRGDVRDYYPCTAGISGYSLMHVFVVKGRLMPPPLNTKVLRAMADGYDVRGFYYWCV